MGCLKCDECCKVLAFEVPDTASTVEFYATRGLRYEQTDGGRLRVWVPHVCPFLTGENECEMQGDKPLVCRVFPVEGMELLPGCGYG